MCWARACTVSSRFFLAPPFLHIFLDTVEVGSKALEDVVDEEVRVEVGVSVEDDVECVLVGVCEVVLVWVDDLMLVGVVELATLGSEDEEVLPPGQNVVRRLTWS
jgi:hypothetical protein